MKENVAVPPLVHSTVIRTETVTEHFLGYGSARAHRQTTIAAEVSAPVIERVNDLEAGDPVRKGQVLIRLDDRQYQFDYERAFALTQTNDASLKEIESERENLESLKQTAEREVQIAAEEKRRVTDLFERDDAAKREFDLARLAYQQALRTLQTYEKELAALQPKRERIEATKRANEAAANIARLNVERCTISAPFDGAAHQLFVDEGDRVMPGSRLLTIVDSSRVEIPIKLPSSTHEYINIGAPCTLSSPSLASVTWNGQVVRVAPVADENLRTFAAYVEVDNSVSNTPLVPGLFVQANVLGPEHESVLLVPRGAIRRGMVLVANEGLVEQRNVKIQRFVEERAIVAGEIYDGDRIILSHLDSLVQGSRVRVAEENSLATTSPRGEASKKKTVANRGDQKATQSKANKKSGVASTIRTAREVNP